MIPGLDAERCYRRNHIAALRGTETLLLHFGGSSSSRTPADQPGGGFQLLDRHGTMPETDDGCLPLINALLPEGAPDLKPEDVWIHRNVLAATNQLIPDRFGFFDSTTLRNIATDADAGISFMNSHRTGGGMDSTPCELPYGKTCQGAYQQGISEAGRLLETSHLAIYMLRDCAPNGANGPNTDTLNRMILGGVLADVSVGVVPGAQGKITCNVCEQDYRRCSHYAGTNRNMTMEDQERARDVFGVPGGLASYRLVNWHLSEISAVYDGAVPGAGFAKGYRAFLQGQLTGDHAAQFVHSFNACLSRYDLLDAPPVGGKDLELWTLQP